jgi:molecular chaperone DnaK
MQQTTIDFGIDLGTTNSVISVSQAGSVEVIKNGLSDVTPSLVYFDKRGTKRVGLSAANAQGRSDSGFDVQAEFKREMGQRVQRNFKLANKSMSPEELSAEVLMELRNAAELRFGTKPDAAVITVPAMFELPQTEATAHAAKLAGFSYSQLLQEPVAAAVAYGFESDTERAYWLVYDFGGGTFDASIVAIRDGQLTVVKHAGDNYLGGADLDWKIVEELLVPRLQSAYSLNSISRAPNASAIDRGRMAVLKRYAENIKKTLSTSDEHQIFEENIFEDDDKTSVDLEGLVTRAEFEALASPSVDRSIEIVTKLISECGIKKSDINRFLLVGGTTFVPLVRKRTAAIGIPIGMELDPMTVVSRGAAIFASSQRLPSSRTKPTNVAVGTATVQLEYDSVAKETSALVGGKVEINGKPAPASTTVRIDRDDQGWNSGDIAIDPKGMFFTQVTIREKGQSVFRLTVRDSGGLAIACLPESFAITNGLAVASSPLPAGCAVGLADGRAEILIPGGRAMPCAPEVYKGQFVRGLKKGAQDSLKVPFLTGDEPIADHNLCGTIVQIYGKDISRDVPPGTALEITVEVDASGVPHIRVFIPLLDQTFEPSERIQTKHESAEVIGSRKDALIAQLDEIENKANSTNLDSIANSATALSACDDFDTIDTLIEKARNGDTVAAGQARNLLVDIAKKTNELNAQIDWPTTLAAYNEAVDRVRSLAAENGDAKDRKTIDDVVKESAKAIDAKDTKMLSHHNAQLSSIFIDIARKDPAFYVGVLAHLSQMEHRFPDRAAARRLFAEAAGAVQRRDTSSLQSVVQQLWGMLPPEVAAEAKRAIGSDVI